MLICLSFFLSFFLFFFLPVYAPILRVIACCIHVSVYVLQDWRLTSSDELESSFSNELLGHLFHLVRLLGPPAPEECRLDLDVPEVEVQQLMLKNYFCRKFRFPKNWKMLVQKLKFSSWCYKTILAGNLDFFKIEKCLLWCLNLHYLKCENYAIFK